MANQPVRRDTDTISIYFSIDNARDPGQKLDLTGATFEVDARRAESNDDPVSGEIEMVGAAADGLLLATFDGTFRNRRPGIWEIQARVTKDDETYTVGVAYQPIERSSKPAS